MEEIINTELATRAVAAMEKTEQEYKPTPLESVEKSVATFIDKSIEATIASSRLAAALEESLIFDLDKMKPEEKIALLNIERSAMNDRISKLITPTIGATVQQEQARMQMKQQAVTNNPAVQVNIGGGNPLDAQLAAKASPEAISGLDVLSKLLTQALAKKVVTEQV